MTQPSFIHFISLSCFHSDLRPSQGLCLSSLVVDTLTPVFFFFFFLNRQIFLFSLSTSMLVKALFLKMDLLLIFPISYTGSMGHLWRTGTALIALLKSYTPRVPSPKKRVVQKEKGLINQGGHILSSEFISMPSGQGYPAPMKQKKTHYWNSSVPSSTRLLNANCQE